MWTVYRRVNRASARTRSESWRKEAPEPETKGVERERALRRRGSCSVSASVTGWDEEHEARLAPRTATKLIYNMDQISICWRTKTQSQPVNTHPVHVMNQLIIIPVRALARSTSHWSRSKVEVFLCKETEVSGVEKRTSLEVMRCVRFVALWKMAQANNHLSTPWRRKWIFTPVFIFTGTIKGFKGALCHNEVQGCPVFIHCSVTINKRVKSEKCAVVHTQSQFTGLTSYSD